MISPKLSPAQLISGVCLQQGLDILLLKTIESFLFAFAFLGDITDRFSYVGLLWLLMISRVR